MRENVSSALFCESYPSSRYSRANYNRRERYQCCSTREYSLAPRDYQNVREMYTRWTTQNITCSAALHVIHSIIRNAWVARPDSRHNSRLPGEYRTVLSKALSNFRFDSASPPPVYAIAYKYLTCRSFHLTLKYGQ